MRTNIYRGVLALAVALAVSAPAYAQTILSGAVTNTSGQPVEGVSVVLVRELDGNTWDNIVTDASGRWSQIGLPSGAYTVSVAKEGVGSNMDTITVASGRNAINFVLIPGVGAIGAGVPEGVDAQLAATLGSAALQAGDYETAILRFTEVVAVAPDCVECFYNIGLAHMNLRQYDDAVAAFERTIELDPMSVDAFNGLASVYNTQRQFDLAAEASARATELSGTTVDGTNVSAIYNQGVVFWNSQQFSEARARFEDAISIDPAFAPAHFRLGMVFINLGEFPGALTAFETYVELTPDGEFAAEARGNVEQLRPLVNP